MRPDRNFSFAPTKANIGMMPLRFRQFANLVDELQAFAKVLETICLLQMMFVYDLPFFQLPQELCDFLSLGED